eukprot:c13629_g1_i2.p1 GENE.c13629_g1_i2~~c13629_g1_i2.p1  ORF type:complete len:153 (+),score=30.99 c13629_g1_i2:78-536(+)
MEQVILAESETPELNFGPAHITVSFFIVTDKAGVASVVQSMQLTQQSSQALSGVHQFPIVVETLELTVAAHTNHNNAATVSGEVSVRTKHASVAALGVWLFLIGMGGAGLARRRIRERIEMEGTPTTKLQEAYAEMPVIVPIPCVQANAARL